RLRGNPWVQDHGSAWGKPVLQEPDMRPEMVDEAPQGPGRWWSLLGDFPALQHRNFRLFILGQGISFAGFWMQSVAQGWLVFRLSGSALALGVVGFAGYAPILCLAPLAGVVIDHVRRQRLLLVTQTLLTLLTFGLAILVATGAVTVPLVVA